MVKIQNNKLIIEFEDVKGFEADTAQRLQSELVELLHCALILHDNGERQLHSAYYGVFHLLQAISPTIEMWEALDKWEC